MKQAQIKCPCCGVKILVRQRDAAAIIAARKIFKAADEMFTAMDAGFKKVFDPSLWRKL
jgi:DNA-directed RNA polymerase subunit RPC12/RpoP